MYAAKSQASRRWEIEAVEKGLLKCETEEAAVRYLWETKPAYLKCGSEIWIDSKEVKDTLKKVKEKLRIHGYDDRAERFHYLSTVLESKWEINLAAYKSLMKFLIEMSERPTEVLNLTIGTNIYSNEPDYESETEEDKPEELLKQLILEELREDFQDVEVHYSSDSDLSDWQLSGSEEGDKKIELVKEKPKLRHSNTFSNFRTFPSHWEARRNSDAERAKNELERFWNELVGSAEKILHENLRKPDLTKLVCQPVISSLVTLHSRFGEFWEWRKRTLTTGLTEYIVLEDDVICELLWQFTNPNATNSGVFNPDWKPKKQIFLSSLTRLSFISFMSKLGEILQKHSTNFKFQTQVENRNFRSQPGPATYRMYAHSLFEITKFIAGRTEWISRNRKIRDCSVHASLPNPCTTLIRLNSEMRDILEIIETLSYIHENSITKTSCEPSWLSSVKLISSLEMHLILETRSRMYALTLFLFSRSLIAFLDDLFRPMETLTWFEDNYLFKRNPNVTLNDSNFWEESVKCQPIQEQLAQGDHGIVSLSCLATLLPNVLNMLKILEMLRLLGEDFRVVLGRLPDPKKIVIEFLIELLPDEYEFHEKLKDSQLKTEKNLGNELLPDYSTHFRYLGLENSYVLDSFKYMLEEEVCSKKIEICDSLSLQQFLTLTNIPTKTTGMVLGQVLNRSLDPYFRATESSLRNILGRHKVDDTIKLFREIILAEREDFAQTVIMLADSKEPTKSDDPKSKDGNYQELLQKFYPLGRENFDIVFLRNSSSLGFKLAVTTHFPLSLILTPKSIETYLIIAGQLNRIRYSLWTLNSLQMKDCKTIETVEPNRMLLLRFSLIHLCSSIRAFLLLKIFSKTKNFCTSANEYGNLDGLLKAHERLLCEMERELLPNRNLEAVVIPHLISICANVTKHWKTGLSLMGLLRAQDNLKKSWRFLNDYSGSHYLPTCELAYHVGPPPIYL